MILAFDTGVTGALACAAGGEFSVEDLPVTVTEKKSGAKRRELNAIELAAMISEIVDTDCPTIFIEETHAMPSKGSLASFSQGFSLGLIKGICTILGGRVIMVSPVTWKKKLGVTADKKTSMEAARKLFPNLAGSLSRAKDHNRAEALLLLYYGTHYVLGEPIGQ